METVVDVESLLVQWAKDLYASYVDCRDLDFPPAEKCRFKLDLTDLDVTNTAKVVEDRVSAACRTGTPQYEVLHTSTLKNNTDGVLKHTVSKKCQRGGSTLSVDMKKAVYFGKSQENMVKLNLNQSGCVPDEWAGETLVLGGRTHFNINRQAVEWELKSTVTVPPTRVVQAKVLTSERKYAAYFEIRTEVKGKFRVQVISPANDVVPVAFPEDFYEIMDQISRSCGIPYYFPMNRLNDNYLIYVSQEDNSHRLLRLAPHSNSVIFVSRGRLEARVKIEEIVSVETLEYLDRGRVEPREQTEDRMSVESVDRGRLQTREQTADQMSVETVDRRRLQTREQTEDEMYVQNLEYRYLNNTIANRQALEHAPYATQSDCCNIL